MRCPTCGAEILENASSCSKCGTRLHSFCPTCSTANLPHFRFCVNCGVPLQSGSNGGGPARSDARAATEINAPLAEGERKHISVLFADISGSLELIRDIDPEEARAIFDLTIKATTAAIYRYKGIVNCVMGDGVMALFGAPIAQEQHAVNATTAALEIQVAIDEFNRSMHFPHGAHISMHIGIDTGEVVVRSMTTDLNIGYDVVGRAAHMASRMQSLAPAGAIRITAETARQIEDSILTRPLGLVHIKGLQEPVEIFEPIGRRPAITISDFGRRRKLTPLVGRSRELGALFKAMERVSRGDGEIWAVVGEPGVGKSRLVYEFLSALRAADWLVVEAMCTAHGATTSLAPIVALLKSFFGIHDAQSHAEVNAAVAAVLAARDIGFPVSAAALALLGIVVEDPRWMRLDAASRQGAIQNILCSLLLPAAESRPIVVVVQDLHWIDRELQLILDRLAQKISSRKIFCSSISVRNMPTHGAGKRIHISYPWSLSRRSWRARFWTTCWSATRA